MHFMTFCTFFNILFVVNSDRNTRHTRWIRNRTSTVELQTGSTVISSNIGNCSLNCENTTKCQSFSFDSFSSVCTLYLETVDKNVKRLKSSEWLFSRDGGNTHATIEWVFTTCGNIGSIGPTLATCSSFYNTSWPNDMNIFHVSDGVQKWKVPHNGLYRIEAYGAAGGYGNTGLWDNHESHFPGGKGAVVKGTFKLNTGTVLNIVCGQMGSNGSFIFPGGGGGGTFVYTGNIGGNGLMIVAGGGGGGSGIHLGFDGNGGEEATDASGLIYSNNVGYGGIGYGGISGNFGSAGAGWASDGEGGTVPAIQGTRWNGGVYNCFLQLCGYGGFGGGGSGYIGGGGGAGGYTGGFGIRSANASSFGGSGGGSFNNGYDMYRVSGQNNGSGFVRIYHYA